MPARGSRDARAAREEERRDHQRRDEGEDSQDIQVGESRCLRDDLAIEEGGCLSGGFRGGRASVL